MNIPESKLSSSTTQDLCSPGSLLVYLLLGALLALVLTLGGEHWLRNFWVDFGLSLLFVQWLVLISVLAFCRLDRAGLLKSPTHIVILLPVVATCVTVTSSLALAWGGFLLSDMPTAWLLLRNGVLAALLAFAFARYLVLQSYWRRRVATDSRARLDALQARIRPHFLFNALNTITELVHRSPVQAEEALLDLSDLLRIGLRSDARHTLAEELELVRGYLRIESLRLGERLQVEWLIDDRIDQELELPALLIQPLIENAVVHGIAARREGGTLNVSLQPLRFGRIRITIENPVPSQSQQSRTGNGTALDNIRQRLALAYEEGASLSIDSDEARFRVRLTLPVKP